MKSYLFQNIKPFDYFLLGPYDLVDADLGCVGDWKNKNYIFNITKFNEIIPKVKQGVHIVSNIKEEFETKFKDYGLVEHWVWIQQ